MWRLLLKNVAEFLKKLFLSDSGKFQPRSAVHSHVNFFARKNNIGESLCLFASDEQVQGAAGEALSAHIVRRQRLDQ